MSSFFSKLGIYILRQFSKVPFCVLYFFADILYFIFRFVIKYRGNVIDKNLLLSFPDLTLKERNAIKERFYRSLADITLESLKVATVSTDKMKERMKFTNLELLDNHEFANKNIVCVMAHYGNWEWFAILNKLLPFQACAIYKPQRSKAADDFMYEIRTRWGSKQFPMQSSFRDLFVLSKKERWIVGVVADQTPAPDKIQYWTNFMNQKTAVHVGTEKIAQKLDTAVVYAWVEKPKRGHYEVKLIPLFVNSGVTVENEITDVVTQTIEKQIRYRPDLWLWSHNRWKRNNF